MCLRRCTLLLVVCIAPLFAQPSALTVNTASREEVRQFYRAVYFASENVPMNWTGNYATGAAGDTSSAFKEATRLRINFYRALVGVPADIALNSAYSAKNQQTALMLSANNALDHFPPTSWTFYTADGAESARNSNLALGTAGPASIDGYIADSGSNNAVVGHRRWLFYPQTRQMGTGDVPGDGTLRPPANAVWVIDTSPGGQFGSARPPTRTLETAYPPAGYIPSTLVWPRWSFSYPGADFSGTTVTMTRNGQPVAVLLETLSPRPGTNDNPTGEPTIVWLYDNLKGDDEIAHPRPLADTPYVVTLANVRIAGAARTFTYTVTVFDPDTPSPDAVPVSVSGSSAPVLGATTTYAITRPTFASGFDWRFLQLSSVNKAYTGESLDDLVATTTPGYNVTQSTVSFAGGSAFRLAHLTPRSDQVLRFPGTYLVGGSSAVTFQSRLAIATSIETARVQVSLDDGSSWSDLYTQAGTSTTGVVTPTESGFTARSFSLAAYAGRTVAVRLVYSIALSGTAFLPEPGNLVGWFVDNLALTNVQSVTTGNPTRITAGNTFSFAPSLAGSFALQARGVIAGAYPLEWGPAFAATATVDPSLATSYLSNLSVRTTAGAGDNTLIVGFAVAGGSKRLLVRAVGPTLAAFGVGGTLDDPKLDLFTGASIPVRIAENDNWIATDAPVFESVGAFALAAGSRDAAQVSILNAGSYTAQVGGNNNGTGIALVELYDTASGTGSRLINVSARSQVGTGDDILVAGFTVAGNSSRKLLIRAVGPMLTAFGVSGALADPKLDLFAAGGASPIASNDNWDIAAEPDFGRVGAFPLTRNSRDAVLVVTLPPGSYTAQISGVGNTTGVALVEVYELP